MRTKKVWILGASGLIGRALSHKAKNIGHSSLLNSELLTVRLDDISSLENSNVGEGDTVFLLAAISSPDICRDEYERAYNVNVIGTSILIQKIIDRGAGVIFFSSDTVYGTLEGEFDDSAATNPVGEYARMKAEVEQRFKGNPSFKSVRLSYVFCREDKFTLYLTRCAENREEAELFHPFYRAIVHREDVIEGALELAVRWDEFPQQIINFGGPQVLSRIDFAECLRALQFHNLGFKVTEPDAEFFKSRPRVIAMKSPVFSKLLGREPRSLCEAVHLEFPVSSNSKSEL